MKKTIYISGIITANLLLIGCIFKVNHWPGASIALTLALVMLSFWFLPVSLVNHYKGQENNNKKWLYIATFICFLIVIIGALFKIMHWPGAGLLLLIGIPIPFILFLPVYIYHSIKDKEQSSVNFTGVILGLTFIAVYSVLLTINISRNVLQHGISLIKSTENVIDFYELKINDITKDNTVLSEQGEIKTVIDKSDEICLLIHKAKKDLLYFTENEYLDSDLGKVQFNAANINHIDSKNTSDYVLIWADGAAVPKIKDKISSFDKYLSSLKLNQDLKHTINSIINTNDITLDDEIYSWEEREFSTSYMIFALETLSRWEKNIRFIESAVVEDLTRESKKESGLLAAVDQKKN